MDNLDPKVYRIHESKDPAPKPSGPLPMGRAAVASRPASKSPYERAPSGNSADESSDTGGTWIATLLFVVVLLVTLSWVGYALVRPFLT